jgi:predicted nuclease of predicted toxin-antitoxin system
VRFLVDAQLPPALARWLGEQGLSAAPVRDVGLRESDDRSILNFALSGGWTVLTKDEDLVTLSIGNPAAPSIVWLRLGNCTNRVLFAWLEPFIPEIQRRLHDGEKLIEVRDAPR